MKIIGPHGVVTADPNPDGAIVDGRALTFEVATGPRGELLVTLADGTRHVAWVSGDHVVIDGHSWILPEASGRRGRKGGADDAGLTAPMPGTVLQVRVAVGDVVEEGDVLMVIEAMKMEHAIRAPRAGTISAVSFDEGARVGPGDPLVELTSESTES